MYEFPLIPVTLSCAAAVDLIKSFIEEAESLKKMEVGEHDAPIEERTAEYDKACTKEAWHDNNVCQLKAKLAKANETMTKASSDAEVEAAMAAVEKASDELAHAQAMLSKAGEIRVKAEDALNEAIGLRDQTIRLWDGRLNRLQTMLENAVDREVRRRSRLQRERAALDAWEARQRMLAELPETIEAPKAVKAVKAETKVEAPKPKPTTTRDIINAQNEVLAAKEGYESFFAQGGEYALECRRAKRWFQAIDAVATSRREVAVAKLQTSLEAARKRFGRMADKVKLPEVLVPHAPFLETAMDEEQRLLKAWNQAQHNLADVEARWAPPVIEVKVDERPEDLQEFMKLLPSYLPYDKSSSKKAALSKGEKFLAKQLEAQLAEEAEQLKAQLLAELGL